MSGPCGDPGRRPVAHVKLRHGLGEFGDEGVVDLVLGVDAVGADAGLAHVAEFRHDRALDRGLDIGVVEHDERRVAAEFEPDLLHRARRLAHEELADLGRAGEADKAHCGVLAHRLADRRRVAREQVQHARRDAGAERQFAEGEGRQRGLGRGLGDRRAADRQRRRELAGDHGGGKVPRRDRGDDAYRLLEDDDARIGAEGRVDLAVDALRLLAEEFDEACSVVHFAARFGEGLSLLARHDERDVIAVGDDEIEPAAQNFRPLFGKRFRPGPEGLLRRLDRAHRLGIAEARDLGDQRPGRGIMDRVDPLADPRAVDQALVFQ